jgi:ABC-type nitrate/sulfonate/bicarbonate transport system permease component
VTAPIRLRAALSWWRAAALLAVLLGAWELYVDLGGADPLILPAPHAIAQAMFDDRGLLWSNFLVTAKEVLLGILVSAIGALGLAIAIHLSLTVRRAVYPLLVASQTIPVPLLAPVLLLWLGFGLGPVVLVVALVSFFVIVVTTLAGLAAIDPALTKTMRTFGASRGRVLWHVELPAAMPGLFTGIKVAVVFAVIGAVFGEQSGVNAGLGYLFEISQAQLLVARSWATIVILSLFAIALFALMTLAERLALPWAHPPTGEGT